MSPCAVGRKRLIYFGIAALIAAGSCSTPPSHGSKEVNFASGQASTGKISEAQLQDSLFRFANLFASRVREGTKNLENSPSPKIRNQALLRRLIYNSAVLDVALGPSPQANLLDMVVFIELCRLTWLDYWTPTIFGQQGHPMSQQFDQASEKIWNIAREVLNPQQRNLLAQLIQRWREQHPGHSAVENVRFTEFSKEAGARAQQMQNDAGGLLASVQGATAVGDRALLFSERALFYAQRAPFLWRLQAQAATQEILTEAMSTLGSAQTLLDQEPRIHSLLNELSQAASTTTLLLTQSAEHPEVLRLASSTMDHLTEGLREWNRIISNPHYSGGLSQIANLVETVNAQSNRLLWKLFSLAALLILLLGATSIGSQLIYRNLARRSARKRRKRFITREDKKAA